MSNNDKDILNQLRNEDTEDTMNDSGYGNNKKTSSKKNISDYIEQINKIWDEYSLKFFKFLKEFFSKKKKKKNFNKNESQKHEKIFKLISRYFWLIVAFSFVLTLIYAFFKVFVFSNEINQKKERVIENNDVMEIGKDVSVDWKDKLYKDVKNNKNSIVGLKNTIAKMDKKNEDNLQDIKKLIKTTSIETQKSFDQSVYGLKKEIYQHVEQNILDNVEKVKKEIKRNTPLNGKLSGTFMEIPKKIQKISPANVSEENTSSVVETKKIKKEKQKEIVQREKDIYYSINIEDVSKDSSPYDYKISQQANNDKNNTLPPFVLRQGLTNGVLVTGISAPTFSDTEKNPAPVFITFKGSSIISNMFKQDVKNCTATGSTFGNIITRRAEILINKISCTYEQDGKTYMVRNNVKGWVYDGNDGRYGIPGILVDHSGTILNDSVIIGMLKGFGNFMTKSASIFASQGQNTATTSGNPLYSPAQVAQTNLVGGIGNQLGDGFNIITDYYKKIIDQLYPYIDVKGGRKITIFFDGGETLTPKLYSPFLVNNMEKYSQKKENSQKSDDDMELEVDVDSW